MSTTNECIVYFELCDIVLTLFEIISSFDFVYLIYNNYVYELHIYIYEIFSRKDLLCTTFYKKQTL